MRGELNRINPTVVEGAEDIFGADERLTNIMNRPKIAGRESKRRIGNRLTSKQMNKLQTMMKSRPVANAESFEGQGCGCGGGNCQCAENFEARTYRRTPQRAKNSPSKGKAAGSVRRGRKSKRQGYNDKMDESMGNGKPMKASRKDRRDESKGMEKSMGNRAYSRVQTMDAEGLYECAECNHWNRNPISGITKCSECGHGKFSKVKNAESFKADSAVADENMVDEGSVDAFYGGGRKVAVSSDGITPTANPSVDEAFNVGNDVGLDVAEQEVMNVNPSVEVNYGADGIGETDVVSTVQDLTSKLGFRVNGLVASALVIGIASMAGYRYAKR